ncbi:MAG: hypothetical protein IK020_06510 [Clostridiales bacterium]|nr:hypothetical protein [Clostridiales bacterium]
MSSPEYGYYDLEQARREELERREREANELRSAIVSCIMHARGIKTSVGKQLEKTRQQKTLVQFSSVSSQDKERILALISEKEQRLDKMMGLCGVICASDYSGELETLRIVKASVDQQAQMLAGIEAEDRKAAAQYRDAMKEIADIIGSQYTSSQHTLEEALAALPSRAMTVSASPTDKELDELRAQILKRAEELLDRDNLSEKDRKSVEDAIGDIQRADNETALHQIQSRILNEIAYQTSKLEENYPRYRQLLAEKISLMRRLNEECKESEQTFSRASALDRAIRNLERDVKELEKRVMEMAVQQEIARCIDETMEELGYHLIGEKNGDDDVVTSLYRFGDETGIRIRKGKDGKVTMRVVGVQTSGRKMNWTDAEIIKTQESFCGASPEIVKRLREKGVVPRRDGSAHKELPSVRYWKISSKEEYTGQIPGADEQVEQTPEVQTNDRTRRHTSGGHEKKQVKRLD